MFRFVRAHDGGSVAEYRSELDYWDTRWQGRPTSNLLGQLTFRRAALARPVSAVRGMSVHSAFQTDEVSDS
uniref:hypothetical protein n=1 Tax=Nocardia cerradoensis TaxID=85688 RepID=UPI0002F1BECB|nr:hypothetical protein [Nocardia cerradoensis]